jgi:hypothetical protein
VPCVIIIVLCGDGIPAINTRLWMVCAFIDTLCKYKAWVMRSLRQCSRCGGGIPVGCRGSGRLVLMSADGAAMAGRVVVEVG